MLGRWGSGSDSGLVHHIDEDWANNDPTNLEILHHGCHVRHHSRGRTLSPEHRAKVVKTLQHGKPSTPESRAKQSAAMMGRSHSHGDKIAAAHKVRHECPDCGKLYNAVWMTRHKNAGKCRSEEPVDGQALP